MLAPVRTVAPADTPVSLEEAKAHLRVDHTDDDDVIKALIAAAVDHLDGWTGILGRSLVKQSLKQEFAGFGCLRLQVGPVARVETISYFDSNNQSQTLPDTAFVKRTDARGSYVDLPPQGIWPSAYVRPDAVSVTYEAGSDAASVPAAIKTAIMLMVASWYRNREATSEGAAIELPIGVAALLATYRRISV